MGINGLIRFEEVGKGLMRAYFSFRTQEAEEDAQQRGGEAVLSVLRSAAALGAHLNGGRRRRLTDQKCPSSHRRND